MKLYSVPEVCKMLRWDSLVSRHYQRVWTACGTGRAGPVLRAGRGFVLTEENVRQLLEYLRSRWPQDVSPEPAKAAQG